MTNLRVSVTELDTWLECKVKWYYSWKLGLRPVADEEDGVSPLISGRTVDFGVQAGLLREPGQDALSVAFRAAALYLAQHGEKATKYIRGVEAAISGMPQAMWDVVSPQSQHKMEIPWGPVTFVGKPDLWYMTENGIYIVDFKSTSKDEWERLLLMQTTNLQPQIYAVLLNEWLLNQGKTVPPLYATHLVLSTRGKHAYGVPRLVSPEHISALSGRIDSVVAEMVRMADPLAAMSPVERLYNHGRISYACRGCDFFAIDEGGLTGADMSDIIATRFEGRKATA